MTKKPYVGSVKSPINVPILKDYSFAVRDEFGGGRWDGELESNYYEIEFLILDEVPRILQPPKIYRISHSFSL